MLQHFMQDHLILGFRSVAKDDLIRFGQLGCFIHPGFHWCCHAFPPENLMHCITIIN